MAMYELTDPGTLRSPALIVSFDGWVNAGSAGTIAASTLVEGGDVVANFDPDGLFDYRVTRPTIDFVGGVMEDVTWPEMLLWRHALEERDLLVLTGTEPNWNWRRFAGEVGELALRLGVVEHVSIGGIPWAAPHTRPVSIMSTASSPDRLSEDDDRPDGLMRVPGAAVSIVEHGVADVGVPTSGFWARVPHYLGSTFAAAGLALVERVAAHLDIVVDSSELATAAADQISELNALVEARPDVLAMVRQLETTADTVGEVSGEELAAEIERFLRQQGDGPLSPPSQ